MLVIRDRKGLITLDRMWFCELEDVLQYSSDATLIRTLRSKNRPKEDNSIIINPSYTVFTDLALDERELLACMRKKVRYEVNRAAKEEFQISYYEAEDIKYNKKILHDFEMAYMSFCDILGDEAVRKAYSREKIESYVRCSCITISHIEKENCIVYHLYVHDNTSTVLLYSVSDFRDKNVDQNLSGRANKLLHYRDMLYFKEKGLESYDWGNISSIEQPNGIDNFKISFGGKVQEIYNIWCGNKFLGKLCVFLLKIMARK